MFSTSNPRKLQAVDCPWPFDVCEQKTDGAILTQYRQSLISINRFDNCVSVCLEFCDQQQARECLVFYQEDG